MNFRIGFKENDYFSNEVKQQFLKDMVKLNYRICLSNPYFTFYVDDVLEKVHQRNRANIVIFGKELVLTLTKNKGFKDRVEEYYNNENIRKLME